MMAIFQDLRIPVRLLLKRASSLTFEILVTLLLVSAAFFLIETIIHTGSSNDFETSHAPLTTLPSLNL